MTKISCLRCLRHKLCKWFIELDLDYLERRGGDTITCENAESGSKEEESPADTLDRVKVVFLGAPGVGKSSIIRVSTDFVESNRYLSSLHVLIKILSEIVSINYL